MSHDCMILNDRVDILFTIVVAGFNTEHKTQHSAEDLLIND